MTETTEYKLPSHGHAEIDDLESPLDRAEFMADCVDVQVNYLGEIPEDTPDVLVLLFQGVDSDGEVHDALLVRSDVPDEDKAAGIMFALAIVTCYRDVDPTLLEALRCKEPDAGGAFIAIGRTRLPAPTHAGYQRLGHMMGLRIGLAEPAVFEVLGTDDRAAVA